MFDRYQPTFRFLWLLALAAPLIVLSGCVSAEKRYKQGMDLEIQGRHAEAVRHYASALEKDPNMPMARGRLLEAGKVALAQIDEEIDQLHIAERFADAADGFLREDELLAIASRVGVELPRPADHPARRRQMLDYAIEALTYEGEALEAEARFQEAVAAYERALNRYQPDPAQHTALDAHRVSALTGWAESDMAAGRFRSAHDRAGRALEIAGGPASTAGARLAALQREALEAGTVRVAMLPLWRTDAAQRGMPDGYLDQLNDVLQDDVWARPPAFVRVAEPASVRRAMREANLYRTHINAQRAADLGRRLEAHLVLAGELDDYRRNETEERREQRMARRKDGGQAAYQVVRYRVGLNGRITYAVVDPQSRRTICQGNVERSASGRIDRVETGASLADLDLNRAERRLFDGDDVAAADRDMERDLTRALSQALAQRVFDCALRDVR